MAALPAAFERALTDAVAPERVTSDPADLAEYGVDWTRVFEPAPSAVVFPESTREVASILTLCNEHRVGVVPSGGRTGLAGGAVACNGELVVSLSRMRRMDPIDIDGETLRVQAGAITEEVHRHAGEHGLTWPVDFASKGSSQVGGNISTNAGGVRVIRYGLTRQWVLGLEVVTAQGEILELGGALEKDNTGLDLRQLFIGSEGTLGVITEATLKLTRLPDESHVALLAVDGMGGTLDVLREARRAPFTISAYEFFTDRCFDRVSRHRGLPAPLGTRPGCYALLEVEDTAPAELEQWLEGLLDSGLARDGVVAQNTRQKTELWQYREAISESLSATGLPHKNDVSLPIARLPAFCADLEETFEERYPKWEICLFGHIGDGNLHINAMKPEGMSKEEFLAATKRADRTIFELVKRHRGSISAEHGIGLLKKPYLGYTRSPAELSLFKAVKQALDPNGVLNPGKIFDP